MKKTYLAWILFALLLIILVQFAAAVPAWKKDKTPDTTTTTTPEPQVIYVNQTVSAPETDGVNWEMIGVIVAIAGVSAGWLISKKVRGKTAKYMSEMDKIYKTHKKNSNKCEKELSKLRGKIEDDFKKGKLNDQGLAILETRIDKYSERLRTEMIEKGFTLPSDLHKKIKHMLSDGIITKEEHAHFLEIIKNDHSMSKHDEARLKALMKKWKTEDKR
ncbi:hypothetical protein ACFL6I_25720 [candidate division KSB1 bacterium]